jgi:hypothetical protein
MEKDAIVLIWRFLFLLAKFAKLKRSPIFADLQSVNALNVPDALRSASHYTRAKNSHSLIWENLKNNSPSIKNYSINKEKDIFQISYGLINLPAK